MPIHEYLCHAGHRTDHLHRPSSGERPVVIPCGDAGCNTLAHHVISAPAPTMGCKAPPKEREAIVVRGGGHDIRCPDVRCDSCEHVYWAVVAGDEGVPPCPKCGAAGRAVLGVPDATVMRRYPYWDRGLGMRLDSPAHRARIMRERGLIAYDDENDNELERRFSAHDREVAEEEADYNKYLQKLEDHPAYADFRRARDSGMLQRG